MTRPTHFRDRDHAGNDLDSNIELDGATASYSDGADLHDVISDLDDRAGGGGGFDPIVLYLERNTNVTGSTSPIIWDTFYDVDQNDTSLTIPAGMGLTTSNQGLFTHTEDGLWLISWDFFLGASPGHTGQAGMSSGGYLSGQRTQILASGNFTTGNGYTLPVPALNGGLLYWFTIGTGSDVLLTYAAAQIIRIA